MLLPLKNGENTSIAVIRGRRVREVRYITLLKSRLPAVGAGSRPLPTAHVTRGVCYWSSLSDGSLPSVIELRALLNTHIYLFYLMYTPELNSDSTIT
jgi:hypothetical protein